MANKQSIDYKKLQLELDELLTILQSGETDLDEALKAYKRGQEIIAQLQTYLKTAENKVTKLTKDFTN